MQGKTDTFPTQYAHGRYVALDLLRGLAAMIVVFVHLDEHFSGLFSPKSGYLAVDLFFLLSGFVIANAYDQRFDAGWKVIEFARVRLIRLYPLYLLALLIGATKLLVQLHVGVSPPPVSDVVTDISFGALMIPSPTTIGRAFDPPFPINLPAWSLFFELVLNLTYAVFYRWLTPRVLLAVIAGSGLALLGSIIIHGSDAVGHMWRTMIFGIPRASFPFFLGIWMSRARPMLAPLGNTWAILLAIALFSVLATEPGSARIYWDIISIFLFFPIFVAVGSVVQVRGRVEQVSLVAGAMSYGLYVVHLPTVGLADALTRRMAPMFHLSVASGPIFVASLVVGCWLLDRYYDRPLRLWLTQRTRFSVRRDQLAT